ncbi:MAG: polysaccharide deacetylase family protein [Planctomycetota bacterium]|nr:polysaccharide deacetylase family protein [Planctomycetota bacterium]
MSIGLRIDVDTWRGTRDGVPALLRTLDAHGIRATWYFTLGPDNMGRHIRRMLRPSFALKMMRSKAASLYGWDILLRGTLWPGPRIGEGLRSTIRMPISAGHEFGVHAWDHHWWQMNAGRASVAQMMEQLDRAHDALAEIAGSAPQSAASPGWRCTDAILAAKSTRPYSFHSDTRGAALPYRVRVNGTLLTPAQIPVDLPTYDELVGHNGVDDSNFNDRMVALLADGNPHVLTIHAESEGGRKAALFSDFLARAKANGHSFVPLGEYLATEGCNREGSIARGVIAGRDDWLAVPAGVTQ